MNKLTKWLKALLGVDELERKNKELHRRIKDLSRLTKDLVEIGADVDICGQEQTTIIVSTKLKGGQVRVIHANFPQFKDIEDLLLSLQGRYNTRRIVVDGGPNFNSKHPN